MKALGVFALLILSFSQTTGDSNAESAVASSRLSSARIHGISLQNVTLEDIDSGLTSPQGNYRWMDVADQIYDVDDLDGYSYNTSYDYTQASVQVDFFSGDDTLHGTLTAANLKPHFPYQFKLVGDPDGDPEANERIGLTGRWWQEQWNGSEWANGQNLNNKGDGSSPSPNDQVYFSRRDIPDAGSPTGRRYRYTGYLVFDYFVTDEFGNASLSFEATSSYHVLWKTTQRSHTGQDGPTRTTSYDVQLPDPVSAYDVDYPQATATVFGEWERLPAGDVLLSTGAYEAEFLLTEESFHGSGWAGGWAAAMAGAATFDIVAQPINDPTIVAVANGAFTVDGLPHRFAGVNYWQGMNLAVDGPAGDRARLGRELDQLQLLGVTNLRVMAASEGPNSEPYRMVPALMTSPGVYDLDVLDGLDYLLAEIGAREMRAVMVLNNFWHWSGGMAQYVSWNEGTSIPYPPTNGWTAFMDYAAEFYECGQCQIWYRDHIAAIVNRLNPYTGVRYRQDPTVFSWELANEPRSYPADWIDDTAAYIRSLDPDHLITTGSEGSMGGDFIDTHDGPDIGYTTIHIWPQNWGWYTPELPGTYPAAELNARGYFQQHATEALVLGKPMVLEEFGLARDWEPLHDIYDPDAPTTLRDLFFGAMFEEVVMSWTTGGPAGGDNLWAWAGEARPGDAWIGDPPHETPGWYSIYDTDESTLAAISAHALELSVCEVNADCDDGDLCNGDEWCDSVSGGCQAGTPLSCDDGDACNGLEICDSVRGCLAGTALVCDDDNACTNDACVSSSCVYTPSGVCSVAGTVSYYREFPAEIEPSTKPVPNEDVDLAEDGQPAETTDDQGEYAFPDQYGTRTVSTMDKFGALRAADHNNAVSPFDAANTALASISELALSANQQIAADVSGLSGITAYDAALISQFAAELIDHFPVATSLGSDWAFLRCDVYNDETEQNCGAPVYVHAPLTQAETDDFYAILFGDVTGNWQPLPPAAMASTTTEGSPWNDADRLKTAYAERFGARSPLATLSLEKTAESMAAGEQRQIELRIDRADGILGLDLQIAYDPRAICIVGTETTGMGSEFAIVSTDSEGSVSVVMYGPLPMQGSGSLLTITVEAVQSMARGPQLRVKGIANEGDIPLQVNKRELPKKLRTRAPKAE